MLVLCEIHIFSLVKRRVVVEQVGYERNVKLVYSLYNVLRTEEAPTAKLVCLLQHDLRPSNEIPRRQGFVSDHHVIGRDLLQ